MSTFRERGYRRSVLITLGPYLIGMVLSVIRVPSEYKECCLTRGKRFYSYASKAELALLRLSAFFNTKKQGFKEKSSPDAHFILKI